MDERLHLAVWLENKGPATARETFLLYKTNSMMKVVHDGRVWDETGTAHNGKALYLQTVAPSYRTYQSVRNTPGL